MGYAVLFTEPETGFHFIAGFVSSHDAWDFMRECDGESVPAGFPFPVNRDGAPATVAEILFSSNLN